MKFLLILLFAIFSHSANSFSQSYRDTSKIWPDADTGKFILVFGAEGIGEVVADISCDEFLRQSSPRSVDNCIRNIDSIRTFATLLKRVTFAKKNRGIDVRCQLLYFADRKIKTIICVSAYGTEVDGRLIKPNRKFKRFIQSTIPAGVFDYPIKL